MRTRWDLDVNPGYNGYRGSHGCNSSALTTELSRNPAVPQSRRPAIPSCSDPAIPLSSHPAIPLPRYRATPLPRHPATLASRLLAKAGKQHDLANIALLASIKTL